MAGNGALLSVKGLKMHFPIEEGLIIRRVVGHIRAVDGIDLEIKEGETLGLVGGAAAGNPPRPG